MPDTQNTMLNWAQSLIIASGTSSTTKLNTQVHGPHMTTSKNTLAREFRVFGSQ